MFCDGFLSADTGRDRLSRCGHLSPGRSAACDAEGRQWVNAPFAVGCAFPQYLRRGYLQSPVALLEIVGVPNQSCWLPLTYCVLFREFKTVDITGIWENKLTRWIIRFNKDELSQMDCSPRPFLKTLKLYLNKHNFSSTGFDSHFTF